jgi:hypothetical protein
MKKDPFVDLTKTELKLFKHLNTPAKIQDFLDKILINHEKQGETLMSPRTLLRTKKAHCIEGAIFAASVLWYHGHKPYLVDLKTIGEDLDHVLAVFKMGGFWGAITKTNHAVLRFREPVYRNIRELVVSYFNEYYLEDRRKSLRSYSKPFNLKKYANRKFLTSEKNLWYIGTALDRAKHYPLLTKKQIRNLRLVEIKKEPVGFL